MTTLVATLLIACGMPVAEKPWWILFADETGGYWVHAVTGKARHDVKLARVKRKPAKVDANSQLRLPPPNVVARFAKPNITTAKGVTVRMLKNRLQVETKEGKAWLTKAGEARRPMLRPDGLALLFLRWDGKSRVGGKARVEDLVLLDLATRTERVLLKKSTFESIAWSPDGKKLAIGRPGKVELFSVKDAKVQLTWKLPNIDKRLWNHGAVGLVFHPDGTQLAARFTFLGGRTAGTKIFGDQTLFILGLAFEYPRQVKLTPSTCEGPFGCKVKP